MNEKVTLLYLPITGGQASEVSSPDQITVQALIVEVKQLQVMQTDAIKAWQEAQQALKEELVRHQQLKLQLEQNKTLSDSLQKQLETLHVERATLQSDTSDTGERLLQSFPDSSILFLQRLQLKLPL